MNMWLLILLFMCAFALQYFFTFLQMRGFTKVYRKCRRAGYRAAIGKFAGAFHAGSIIMFAIDKEGVIQYGSVLQGVTVLSRFKDFNLLNNRNVDELDEEFCKDLKVSYSIKKAIIDCNLNYKTIMRGEEVPVPPSPFKKAGLFLTNTAKNLRNSLTSSLKL